MPEGLKLVVSADVKQAEKALKSFVGEAQASGKAAGTALGKGLNTAVPAIQNIQKVAKPAAQAVSKLGDTIETLRGKLLAKQSFLVTEKDVVKVGLLNREIKQLQSEILRVQTIGASGVNLGGAGAAAGKAFSVLRQAAFVLPGIGIAGILGGITSGLASLFSSADKANEKVKELVESVSEIRNAAGASTAGEAAKVSALANIVLDQTKAYEQRNRALNELKAINKNYFGDLTLEGNSLAKLTGLVNEYTAALIQQAVIKKFQDKIADVTVAMSEQVPQIAKASAELQKFQRRAASLNGDDFFFNNIKIHDAEEALRRAQAPLSALTGQSKDLRNALNSAVLESLKFKPLDDKGGAKTKVDDIIAQAKRLAAFLDKNTQFEVKFEVDETVSEEENKKSARAFIDKARSFIEKQTPEFKFKPLIRAEFKFINDGKFLSLIRDQAGIEATKTFAEVKKEFEANIKRLAESNPITIPVTANIAAGIKQEDLRAQALASGTGVKLPDVGPLGTGVLSEVDKQAIATANTITGLLTPAFQNLFSSIKAGENPLKAFFDGIGQAVQQLIQKLIAAAVQALILSAIFPGGVGGVKGFGSIFKNILGFASGGVVSGPTLAMIGEGSGTSRSNPEIVAPLNQLRAMLGDIGGGNQTVVVMGRISGNDIKLSNSRTNRRDRRLGA